MLGLDPFACVAQRHIFCNFPYNSIPTIILHKILIHLCTSRMNGIGRLMGFTKNSLAEDFNIWYTYSLLKPYCTLFIFTEMWSFSFFYLLLDLLKLLILELTFSDILLQGRIHFHNGRF